MTTERVLETAAAPGVRRLTLNRPERRNALDGELVAALTRALARAVAAAEVRVVLLAAAGSAFCAGADLRGMQDRGRDDANANLRDAEALARLLLALRESPKPVVALVQGPAFGGGVGLAAACDVAIGAPAARFRLPEVQLGIVPAVISPYVVAAVGARAARRLFLAGEPVDAEAARELGLLHEVVDADALDARGLAVATAIAQGGPHALAVAKRLVDDVDGRRPDHALAARTAALLAELRAGAEAQEGLAAALEKRAPTWRP